MRPHLKKIVLAGALAMVMFGAFTQTASAEDWRYRFHNGQWWYWMPDNHWVYWHDNAWTRFDARTYVNPGWHGSYYGTPYGYRPYWGGSRYYSGYSPYGRFGVDARGHVYNRGAFQGGNIGAGIGGVIGGGQGANIGAGLGAGVGAAIGR